MKTSIILIIALLINTTLLVAEPLASMLGGLNSLVFLVLEAILVFAYFLHRWLKKLNEAYKIDFGYLNVLVLNSTHK